jgi:hypothetical protein
MVHEAGEHVALPSQHGDARVPSGVLSGPSRRMRTEAPSIQNRPCRTGPRTPQSHHLDRPPALAVDQRCQPFGLYARSGVVRFRREDGQGDSFAGARRRSFGGFMDTVGSITSASAGPIAGNHDPPRPMSRRGVLHARLSSEPAHRKVEDSNAMMKGTGVHGTAH